MELACQCPAVVCCRCAPTQKAQIVRLLQERTGKLTCAVGRWPPGPFSVRMFGPWHCVLRIPQATLLRSRCPPHPDLALSLLQ